MKHEEVESAISEIEALAHTIDRTDKSKGDTLIDKCSMLMFFAGNENKKKVREHIPLVKEWKEDFNTILSCFEAEILQAIDWKIGDIKEIIDTFVNKIRKAFDEEQFYYNGKYIKINKSKTQHI
ncbi:MAG: hypothetical protein LBG52_09355 [Candidatus Peribacteria bacterium]|jgi:hypothetical protein|nr:hypothetical protein [Candidatus Peribacteria bacterium]